MEELELFKKKADSYIEKAYDGGVSLSMFLDEPGLAVLEERLRKHPALEARHEGGFLPSDRIRAMICPAGYPEQDFKITVFRINYNKRFYSVNHRSILGALMSLGIKRECIGDIVITEEGDAYFACVREMSRYISDNLHSIGSAFVELEETREEIRQRIRYEEKVYFVSSLRLDAVIAAAYGLSRKEALQMIADGMVFIRHLGIHNPSHTVKLDDEISVRHKGRFRLQTVGGASKSGRIAITLAKRV